MAPSAEPLPPQRVLVTAGAGGIGLEIARAFAASGARVHVCDIDAAAVAALCAEAGGVSASVCDVTDREAVSIMVAEAVARLGGLDVLVNNAGIAGPTARIEHIDPAAWDRTLAVNLTGTFNVTRLAVPHLQAARDGAIVNIGSLAGRVGFPRRSAYAATKWALVGLTKTLSIELGEFGIRVNAVLPGAVDGPRLRQVIESKARDRRQPVAEIELEVLAGMSIKRLVQPAEVAAMAVFLASAQARTLSGQAIAIDGDAQSMA